MLYTNIREAIKRYTEMTKTKKREIRDKVFVAVAAVVLGTMTSIPLTQLFFTVTTTVDAATTGTVTADRLNVRTGPGTNNRIMEYKGGLVILQNGTKVTIKSSKSGWYKVSFIYKGKKLEGYVCDDYIKKVASTAGKTNANTGKSQGKVTATYLNVRTGTGTSSDILKYSGKNVQLKKGTIVTINSKKNGWYSVTFSYKSKTLKGYVSGDYIKVVTASTTTKKPATTTTKTVRVKIYATVNTQSLNVRTGAGTSSARLKQSNKNVMLDKGVKVTILGEQNVRGVKWFKISFTYNKKNLTGYVHGHYLNITVPKSGIAAKTLSTNNVYVKSNTSGKIMTKSNKKVTIAKKSSVTVLSQKIAKNENWYKISFKYKGAKIKGYIKASEANLIYSKKVTTTVKPTVKPTTKATAKPTTKPTVKPTTKATAKPTKKATAKPTTKPTVKPTTKATAKPTTKATLKPTATAKPTAKPGNTVVSDKEFKSDLKKQGFPDDYITKLMKLHKEHPNWKFKAYDTGISWNDAISSESGAGVNLIPNTKNPVWKSTVKGAYKWAEDRYVIFDNPNWVTASKAIVSYYMDPRNFLNDSTIFMFETLSYDEDIQTRNGVEAILKNTPMYKTYVTYKDDKTNKSVKKLYSQIFMDAAKYSGVNPYHLASRSKQEIVSSATTLSSSVSGKVAGYEGLYNYYNIGAYNSTVSMGAIKNGLNYAKKGSTNASKNEKYLIPWSTPYKAIVGGGYFIGASYINVRQNTIYLQKFNVTERNRYTHQYMGNVQAAYSEAIKVGTAYKSMDDYEDIPIVFSIPIYNSMPEKVSELPANTGSPNNWLKSLSVSGYSLTPTFDISATQEYTVTVPSTTSNVTINATTVNTNATVTGTGKVRVVKGINTFKIVVRAENGSKKTYTLNVVRKS